MKRKEVKVNNMELWAKNEKKIIGILTRIKERLSYESDTEAEDIVRKANQVFTNMDNIIKDFRERGGKQL